MNRLVYLLKAQTQYHLHSPFMFNLYNTVLTTRLRGDVASSLPRQGRAYYAMLYKMANHFHATQVSLPEVDEVAEQCIRLAVPQAELSHCGEVTALQCGEVKVALVKQPHRSRQQQALWQALGTNPQYNITIDMYHVGIALYRHGLHPQHFILR